MDGAHGVIKVVVEERVSGLYDGSPVEGSFVAQGAGTLVVQGGRWYVVTARHLVVPDPDLRSIAPKDGSGEVLLDKVEKSTARLALGSLGARVSEVSWDLDKDVALLLIPDSERSAAWEGVAPDSARPISASVDPPRSGLPVEAWGFPTGPHPQVFLPAIAAVEADYLVLNTALPGGTSGGPVLVVNGTEKQALGIVFRSDDASGQSLAVPWSAATALLSGGRAMRVDTKTRATWRGIDAGIEY